MSEIKISRNPSTYSENSDDELPTVGAIQNNNGDFKSTASDDELPTFGAIGFEDFTGKGEYIGAGGETRVVGENTEYYINDSAIRDEIAAEEIIANSIIEVVQKFNLKRPYIDALLRLAEALDVPQTDARDYELMIQAIDDALPDDIVMEAIDPPKFKPTFRKRNESQLEFEKRIKPILRQFEAYYVKLAKMIYKIVDGLN